jgi:chorismate dehydratase
MTPLGSVPYVNAYPLVQELGPARFSVRLEEPSRLPALLDAGEAEAVLASSFEALRTPGRRVVRGTGIATEGPAESVRLFSRVAPSEIRTLALDDSSLTSNHLALLWLAESFGVGPETARCAPDLAEMLATRHAAVLIGDRGMEAASESLLVFDLGECWTQLTGLPFVWALWIGGESLSEATASALNEARVRGLENLEPAVHRAMEVRGWSEADARRYLGATMRYALGDREEAGLARYGELLVKHGLLESAQPRDWVG